MQVWANADYPRDAERARAFGAQGIGLCRTEHMFFEGDRLPTVRRMILNAHAATAAKHKADADRTAEERESVKAFDTALAALEKLQTDDFAGLFRAMDGLPVVIRLIDPPLHEFLPSHEELIADVTRLRTTLELAADGSLGVDAGLVQQGLTKLFGTKDAARAMRKIGLSKPEPGAIGPGVRSVCDRGRAGREGRAAARRRGHARAEPDARPARRAARPDGPRHRQDADAGHPRRRRARGSRGADAAAGDHDPAASGT